MNDAQYKLIVDGARKAGAKFPTNAAWLDFKAAIDAAVNDNGAVVRAPAVEIARQESPITARIALELISHEAIVAEAYKDSVGVWTWGVGVTNASGHEVHPRYLDKPQDVRKCLEVYIWLLTTKYLPPVLRAFKRPLAEHELGAALSFHYNTGAIGKASWVQMVNAGDMAAAELAIMNYRKPPEIIPRRKKERDLFFDGKWSGDGRVTVYPVRKPSYAPNWGGAKLVDVSAEIQELLA